MAIDLLSRNVDHLPRYFLCRIKRTWNLCENI